MRKDWVLITIIVLILVLGIGLASYLKYSKKEIIANPLPSVENQQVAGAAIDNQSNQEAYFSQEAKVMFFYSDLCHWCEKQKKEVLEPLGQEGYKVKPMNVGKNQELVKEYKLSGTPTFIAEGGETLVGYQTQEALKAFLEAHK